MKKFTKPVTTAGLALAVCAGSSTLIETSALATPFTLNISGTIASQSGSSAPLSPFSVGDSFAYSVTLDDSMTGPGAGGATRDLNNVSDFSFSLGSYAASGSSGDVFLRNDGVTGVFSGAPYDQFTVQHLSEPVYAQGFGMPGRTDFQTTSGQVVGHDLRSISFNFQTPNEEFVGLGESLLSIAQNVESNPAILASRLAGGGGSFSVDFSNDAFGSTPLSIDLNVSSFAVDTGAPTGPGSSPTNPVLPGSTTSSGFVFNLGQVDPAQTIYIDPDVATGYDYQVTSGPNFASVIIPSALPGGDGEFTLDLGALGLHTLLAGNEFDFLALDPLGLSEFSIFGISPSEALDPLDPLAFVTGLKFVSAGDVTMTQNPIVTAFNPVPEPAALAIFGFSLAGLGFAERRRRGRTV